MTGRCAADDEPVMLVVPLEAGKRADLSSWHPHGMRASATGTLDFTGFTEQADASLGDIPWAGRVWAPPFLTAPVPSERAGREQGRRHKTLLDVGRPLALQARRWLPERDRVRVGDGAFSVRLFREAVPRAGVTAITRLRLDAALPDPAPPRLPGLDTGARARRVRGSPPCPRS